MSGVCRTVCDVYNNTRSVLLAAKLSPPGHRCVWERDELLLASAPHSRLASALLSQAIVAAGQLATVKIVIVGWVRPDKDQFTLV